MKQVNQYDIVLVNLDPTIGSEMKKTRPCIVVSPDEMNKPLQTVVIAPITSSPKPYPTRIEINHKSTKEWIALDQVRTIDKIRIVKIFESLSDKEIQSVKSIIRETFVD